MCAKHGLWEPEQIPTLLYLWRLAAGSGGYEVRGVRGWAHREGMEAGIGCSILSLLPQLFRRRLLHRVDTRRRDGSVGLRFLQITARSRHPHSFLPPNTNSWTATLLRRLPPAISRMRPGARGNARSEGPLMKKLILTPRVAASGAVALVAIGVWAYLMVGWARVLF
jgi:hypothetical protein